MNCKFMEETAVLYQPEGSDKKNLYFFRNKEQRDIFIDSPDRFSDEFLFPPKTEVPEWVELHEAAQVTTKEKNLANYCPVSLYEDDKIIKGFQLYLVNYKGTSLIFTILNHCF